MSDFPPELKGQLISESRDYIDELFEMAVAEKGGKGKKGEAKRALQKAAGNITTKTAELWSDRFNRVIAEDWSRLREEEAKTKAAAMTAGADGFTFDRFKAWRRIGQLREEHRDAMASGDEGRERRAYDELHVLSPLYTAFLNWEQMIEAFRK